jgi:hypothetical protein
MELSLMAGPGRHWANLWKPLIDALGSVLGEVLLRAFSPALHAAAQIAHCERS